MPIKFNPRQGGFQSVAPKNPIEKAIDKSQQDTKNAPGVNKFTVYSGRGSRSSSSNPITSVSDTEVMVSPIPEVVKQATNQEIISKSTSSPTNFINELLNKSKEVQVTGQSTKLGDFLIRQDKGNVIISDSSGVKYSVDDLQNARGNVITSKKDFTQEEKDFIKSQGKNIDFTSKTTPLTQAFTLSGKPVLKALDKLDKSLPTTENVFGIDLTKDVVNQPTIFKDTDIYTADVKETVGGTTQVFPREKDFFEKINIKINKNSLELKDKYDDIAKDFNEGRIDQTIAQQRLDDSIKTYVNKEAVSNIPKTVALGTALGLLNIYLPVAGKVVNTAFGTQLFLNRDKIKDQLKNFPVATAIDTASFLAGGIVGNVSGNALKAGKTKIQITPENFEKGINLLGEQRTNAVTNALQSVEPKYQLLVKQGKLTASDVFTATTKDGRTVTMVRLSKAKGKDLTNLKGEDIVIGYEKLKTGEIGRRFLGKSVNQIVENGVESYTQGYVFKPNAKASKFFDKVNLKDGISVEILERSKLISTKAKGTTSISRIESESKILRTETINKSLFNKIQEIQRKLDRGEKVGIYDLKNLINLEKRATGDKPFTEKEWNQSNIKQLSQTDIVTIIDKAKLVAERVEKGVVEAKSVRLNVKERFVGKSTVKTVKEPIRLKRKSIEKGITISKFSKNIDKLAKERGIKKSELKETKLKAPKSLVRQKGTTVQEFSKNIDKYKREIDLLNKARVKSVKTSLLAFGKPKKSEFKSQVRPNVKEIKQFVRGGAFAGQGTYERTESVISPRRLESQMSNVITKQRDTTNFKDNTKIKLLEKNKTRERTDNKFKVSQVDITSELTKDRTNTSQVPQLKVKQFELTKQKEFQVNRPKFRERFSERTKTKFTPKVLPRISPRQEQFKKREEKIKQVKRSGFDTYLKRQGKFIRVNPKPFISEQQAKGFGFAVAKSNLGQSVVTIKTSRINPISSTRAQSQFNRLQREFRPSKSIRGASVQKNPLSSKIETKQIQQAKEFKRVGAPKIRSIK